MTRVAWSYLSSAKKVNIISHNVALGELRIANKMSKRRRRATAYPEIQEATVKWIKERRTQGLAVWRSDVREFALGLAKESGQANFKASDGWITDLMQKNTLSFRARTKTSRKTEFTAEDKVSSKLKIKQGREHLHFYFRWKKQRFLRR